MFASGCRCREPAQTHDFAVRGRPMPEPRRGPPGHAGAGGGVRVGHGVASPSPRGPIGIAQCLQLSSRPAGAAAALAGPRAAPRACRQVCCVPAGSSPPLLVRGLSEGRDLITLTLTAHQDTRRLGVPWKAQIHAVKSDEIKALSENVGNSAKPGKEGSASRSCPEAPYTSFPPGLPSPRCRQGGS